MSTSKSTIPFVVVLALAVLGAGCTVERPAEVITGSNPPALTAQRAEVSKRFEGTADEKPTAVRSAIELSARYAKLAEQMAALKEENLRLLEENRDLKDQLEPCREQLEKAQKELAEANDLLIEMRIELNNWKTNVLGFRDEIRQADEAQLEALLKILQVLGGEVDTNSRTDGQIPTAPGLPQEPAKPREQTSHESTNSRQTDG